MLRFNKIKKFWKIKPMFIKLKNLKYDEVSKIKLLNKLWKKLKFPKTIIEQKYSTNKFGCCDWGVSVISKCPRNM